LVHTRNEDGVLLKRFKENLGEQPTYQLAVLKSLRSEILKLLYDSPCNGHLGLNKTIAKLTSMSTALPAGRAVGIGLGLISWAPFREQEKETNICWL
jgi:hypothetical protein